MKAIIKYEKGIKKVKLGDMPIPEPKKGEIRIKVKVAGICGTDLHIYYDDIYPTNPPVILGHEISGIIDSLGEGVKDISVGERVTSETYYYTCGTCCYCRTGRNNLCNKRLSIGSGVNGGFTEYLVVPAKNIHRIPSNISFEEAAMTEPLACCIQAVLEKTKITAGDNVLITGPGAIGLLCLQLVKASGAQCILVGAPKDADRLKLAEKLGADLILDTSNKELANSIEKYCNNIGPDIVLECSGAEAAAKLCLDVIKKGGMYTQVGLFSRPITMDLTRFTLKELVLNGTFAQKWPSWEKAIKLLSKGLVKTKPLISEVMPLEQWEEAFDKSSKGIGIKYLLTPLKK